MGWFNKNKKVDVKKEDFSLPRLPELPRLDFDEEEEPLPQLPKFPTNSFGEKFSRNAIKDAIAGKKEGDEILADEEPEEEYGPSKMPESLKTPITREIDYEMPNRPKIREERIKEPIKKIEKKEPVFIRVDKFEQALNTFAVAKEKVLELENMLKEIKKIKDQEEKELESWEIEIQSVKAQIEKVDRDIFSKIE